MAPKRGAKCVVCGKESSGEEEVVPAGDVRVSMKAFSASAATAADDDTGFDVGWWSLDDDDTDGAKARSQI